MTADTVQLVNLALAALNFGVASLLVLRGFSVSREIGAASTAALAQSSYEALLDTREAIQTADDAERFYDRFWASQVLQFEQWRARLIPDLVYMDWLLRRLAQYQLNTELGGVPFRDAWASRYERRYRGTRFGAFMDRIMAKGLAQTTPQAGVRHVRAAMRRFRMGF